MGKNGTVISIIVPFYNGNKYLKNLFQCITNNTITARSLELEVILVNDSPDVKIKYEKLWIDGFSLKIVENKKNYGIHQSRVNGVKSAVGVYILFLDQDDLIQDDAIISQFQTIEGNDIVVGNGFDENKYNFGNIYRSPRQQKLTEKKLFYCAIGSMIVSPGQCLIRKEAIPHLWYKTILKKNGSDDLLLWMLMLSADVKWTTNFKNIYLHVDTGENYSSDNEKMTMSSLAVLEILKKYGLISKRLEKLFKRRFKMKNRYYGKNNIKKIQAILSYPDISFFLLINKLL